MPAVNFERILRPFGEVLTAPLFNGIEVRQTRFDETILGQTVAKGSYVVQMDQPYSRLADTLLDVQYVRGEERVYDDTGWTLGLLKNVPADRLLVTESGIATREADMEALIDVMRQDRWPLVRAAALDAIADRPDRRDRVRRRRLSSSLARRGAVQGSQVGMSVREAPARERRSADQRHRARAVAAQSS